jgi:NadR type nicotinamide-nucleotide adenylyltransferase
MIRVVFTGSESTGKSTLAAAVAKHYGVEVVPEFVRAFAEQKGTPIEFSDHGAIARGQIELEDEYIMRATQISPALPALPALLIQDTDLLSTVVYCRHYFGHCPPWIEEAAVARRPDLYLLCDIDTPWIADGVRDRGHLRDEMQRLFEEAIKAAGTARLTLSGTVQTRLREAIDGIDQFVASGSADL